MNKIFRLTLLFLLVFNSIAYADFTPPTSEHADDANTMTLLHMNGTDASTTFTDDSTGGVGSPHTYTARNSAQLDTAQQKFGTASGLFASASSDSIDTPDSADWTWGSSDYTIDFWLRPASGPSYKIAGQHVDGNNVWYIQAVTTNLYFFWKDGGIVRINSSCGATLTTNTWYHLVWSRDVAGNAWHWYVDGVEKAVTDSEGTANTTLNDVGAAVLTVGLGYSTGDVASYTDGWIDEFRISNTLRTFAAADTGSVMVIFVKAFNPNLIGTPAWTMKIKVLKWWKNLTWDIKEAWANELF